MASTIIAGARRLVLPVDLLLKTLLSCAGPIAGAGLGLVVNLSPPLEHKLIQLGNVLVTPHTAFFSQEAVLGRTRAALS